MQYHKSNDLYPFCPQERKSSRRGRNRTFEYIKRELDTREKKKPTKVDLKNVVSCMVMIMLHYLVMVQGMFVDKQRNAAVVLGDRDLKRDVRDKKKRFYALSNLIVSST